MFEVDPGRRSESRSNIEHWLAKHGVGRTVLPQHRKRRRWHPCFTKFEPCVPISKRTFERFSLKSLATPPPPDPPLRSPNRVASQIVPTSAATPTSGQVRLKSLQDEPTQGAVSTDLPETARLRQVLVRCRAKPAWSQSSLAFHRPNLEKRWPNSVRCRPHFGDLDGFWTEILQHRPQFSPNLARVPPMWGGFDRPTGRNDHCSRTAINQHRGGRCRQVMLSCLHSVRCGHEIPEQSNPSNRHSEVASAMLETSFPEQVVSKCRSAEFARTWDISPRYSPILA